MCFLGALKVLFAFNFVYLQSEDDYYCVTGVLLSKAWLPLSRMMIGP